MAQHMRKMHKGARMHCPMCPHTKAEHGVVNVRCPIMGTKIDPADVPEELTRQWKGKTVGFCCPGCPAKWDELTDEQKKEKLKAVMPEMKRRKWAEAKQEEKEKQPEDDD
jgi:hypothetical protein